ncbi:MAG: DMT family transporter [Dethiosulfatibacter sp.]|nr:DMT family transporter [Dethiosulfatibacter sp.]
MSNYSKGVILVLISTISFGLMPVFVVFAYESGIETSTLLLLRFIFSTVFFFTYVFKKYKIIQIDAKALFSFFILGGICYTMQSRFYFSSLRYISPALATLFLYTYPAIVSVFSAFIDKERLTGKVILSLLISLSGILLIVGTSWGNINVIGILFSSGASLVYSFYIVYSSRVIKKTPAIVASAYIALFSTIGTFVLGTFSGGFNFSFTASAWLPIAGLALVSTVIAISSFLKGMEYLGPTKTSIISLTEAVFTVLFSVIFLHDFLTPYQIMGGAAVLLGAYIIVRNK